MQRKNPNRVRALRRARTMSQQQLASIVEVSQNTISMVERGQLEISSALKSRIAATLGTTPEELFPNS